jgi:hypothetical protein
LKQPRGLAISVRVRCETVHAPKVRLGAGIDNVSEIFAFDDAICAPCRHIGVWWKEGLAAREGLCMVVHELEADVIQNLL